jgi:hypothetical protein
MPFADAALKINNKPNAKWSKAGTSGTHGTDVLSRSISLKQ